MKKIKNEKRYESKKGRRKWIKTEETKGTKMEQETTKENKKKEKKAGERKEQRQNQEEPKGRKRE
jgi:hypothetical protein